MHFQMLVVYWDMLYVLETLPFHQSSWLHPDGMSTFCNEVNSGINLIQPTSAMESDVKVFNFSGFSFLVSVKYQ